MEGSGCRLCSSQTSIPEIRLYCELKSVYKDALGREKVKGIEADIIIPSLNLAIEYDGFHYHKDKVQKDEDKTKQFSLLGYTMMRLREPPLAIGSNDVATSRSRTKPTKDDINLFVSKIIDLIPEAKPQGEVYLKEKEYIADVEFRRILSFLPGPPEENSLAQVYPKVSERCAPVTTTLSNKSS